MAVAEARETALIIDINEAMEKVFPEGKMREDACKLLNLARKAGDKSSIILIVFSGIVSCVTLILLPGYIIAGILTYFLTLALILRAKDKMECVKREQAELIESDPLHWKPIQILVKQIIDDAQKSAYLDM